MPEKEETTLTQNAVNCLDEDTIISTDDGDLTECPHEPGHSVEALHLSVDPLGFLDDKDYFHHGLGVYAYPAMEAL